MSIQANYCVQLLMLFYAELDQRTGWGDRAQVLKLQKSKGVAEGRTENALDTLIHLKMLDVKVEDGKQALRLSNYGVDWFEKHFDLVERGKDSYRYEWSPFRKIRLVPPEQFYGRTAKTPRGQTDIDWTMWGAILGGIGIIVSIALWKLS